MCKQPSLRFYAIPGRPFSALALALALAGCGGSDNDSSQSLEVTAIDGYLSQALVWLDLDGDSQLDEDEPQATTDATGRASLTVTGVSDPSQYRLLVQAIAGQTQDLGDGTAAPETLTRSFVMVAPAGQTVVTPLSTLVAQQLQQQGDGDLTAALAQVAGQLGLEEAALLGDFLAQGHTQAQIYALNLAALLPETLAESDDETLLAQGAQMGQALTQYLADHPLDEQTDPQSIRVHSQEGVLVAMQDSDNDGSADDEDAFPLDPSEHADTDDDGVGDHADVFPLDPDESSDTDGDGVGDHGDAFPQDAGESADTDGDGVGDHADAFPQDAGESADTDGDGVGNHADVFPQDPSESADTDGDGVGDNADAFAEDASESRDSDGDGVGDNGDAYPQDASKSVADRQESRDEVKVLLQDYLGDARTIRLLGSRLTETFNDGHQRISETWVSYDWDPVAQDYVYLDGEPSQQEVAERLLVRQADGSYQEQAHWQKDYNRDNQLKQQGQVYAQGQSGAAGEESWHYYDETDPLGEGIADEVDRSNREYDGGDLAAQVAAGHYGQVDFIQHKLQVVGQAGASRSLCPWAEEQDGDALACIVEYEWADMASFDPASSQPHYGQLDVTRALSDGGSLVIQLRDWAADGNYNEIYQTETHPDGRVIERVAQPVWANPQDQVFEEYADYNWNRSQRAAYWYEHETIRGEAPDQVTLRGARYLLDYGSDSASNGKLVDADHPDGYRFNDYEAVQRQVGDDETREFSTWHHYQLADHPFTLDDQGQDYKIYRKEANDLWVGHRFAEWGSQLVADLPGQVEALRQAGVGLADIDAEALPGLSDYNGGLLSTSFRYAADGRPRTWYWVTNWPVITGDESWGSWQLLSLQLVDGGLDAVGHSGWRINDAAGSLVLLQPVVEMPWAWYDAYAQWFISPWLPNGDVIDPVAGHFSSWQGHFFLQQVDAEGFLAQQMP